MKDDEIVVVADCFSDGVAQIAEVSSRREAAWRLLSCKERSKRTLTSLLLFLQKASDRRVRVILNFKA